MVLAAGVQRAAALVALLAVTAATADDFFSPLAPIFAPVINSICSTVACGKGNCTVAPGTLGYRCECDPGWTQLHVGDELRFLPCVIPNCSIDSSCSNGSSAPAPTPLPAPKNFSLNPCELAYCGTGGTCRNGSGLSYHCECKEGYSNLLNMTTLPCFQNCSIGADCSRIGILPFSNSSNKSPAPPSSESISNNGIAAAPGSISQRILMPLLLIVSLAVSQVI
ncbi:hypothetical protein SEVIR_9G536500v4 [Setaria viridis]|uniref:EGF-like domain-containing protein n=2 Tax=Setaria TaxID=4554 RepID=K4AEV7_SETIT|nr:neurogenic locus notch homolog protein 3 [Setaria italica]XP_034571428.1 neurogenic locus notch homolog protein 3 [Setaria viridis]RCV46441.1 hypothetical protein SETIT_9G532200v2 [Setaria italica]TKV98069.1 hypothetical protein SEVIR_9G536500v2 [Setaria viridis]